MQEKVKPMRYFLNDVEVTEAEYKAAMKAHTIESNTKFNTVSPVQLVDPKAPKAKKSRKVAKMPAPVLTPEVAAELNKVTIAGMADKPKKGSKTEAVANLIRTIGLADKEACIKAIMAEFNTSKANATCYIYNIVKKGLV